MTSAQFRAALSCLDLSQVGAAKLLRISERTSRRWAQYGVTGPGEILLQLLSAGKITVRDISDCGE